MGDESQSLLPQSAPSRGNGETQPRSPGSSSHEQYPTFRAHVHDMVEGTLDTWFEWTLLGVIFFNVMALIVSTIPTGRDKGWCALAYDVTDSTANGCFISLCCCAFLVQLERMPVYFKSSHCKCA